MMSLRYQPVSQMGTGKAAATVPVQCLLLIQIICFGHKKKIHNQQHSPGIDRENDRMIQNETK